MRWLILLFSLNAYGMTSKENETIEGIVNDCRNISYYNDMECWEVLLSTQIVISEYILCMYLPLLRGCP